MNTFKKGDKVVCIDDSVFEHHLTSGKTYEVQTTNAEFVRVLTDGGITAGFFAERFIPAPAPAAPQPAKAEGRFIVLPALRTADGATPIRHETFEDAMKYAFARGDAVPGQAFSVYELRATYTYVA